MKTSLAILAATTAFAGGVGTAYGDVSDGRFIVTEAGPATLHSYVAGEEAFHAASHIVESEAALVIIDAQLLDDDAEAIRSYAEALGKPIVRVILTGSHPDRWYGVDTFYDVPTYASEATRNWIARETGVLGDGSCERNMEAKNYVPDAAITPGSEVIDGLRYDFQLVNAGQGHDQLIVRIPEARALIAPSLIANGFHLNPAESPLDIWIAHLKGLWQEAKTRRDEADIYTHVFGGRGGPGGTTLIAENVNYLEDARTALAAGGESETIIETLTAEYPDYGAEGLLRIGVYIAQAETSPSAHY